MKDIFNDTSRFITKTISIQPYQIDSNTSGTVYTRWTSGTGKVIIMKEVTADNVKTYTKTYDTWANRATATYVAIDAEIS